MAEHPNLPPLSGEIMSDDAARDERVRADRGQAVDAVFETLPRAQQASSPAPAAVSAAAPQGMDMLRGDKQPKEANAPGRAGAGFWLAGMTLVAMAFWFSGGHTLARQILPLAEDQTATGVRVSALTSRIEETGGRLQLLVDGGLDNPSPQAVHAPGIVINVTAGNGSITRYRLGTGGREIEGGGTWRFSSRIEAPRSGVKSVSVTVDAEAAR